MAPYAEFLFQCADYWAAMGQANVKSGLAAYDVWMEEMQKLQLPPRRRSHLKTVQGGMAYTVRRRERGTDIRIVRP